VDAWHGRIVLQVDDIERLERELTQGNVGFVSPQVVSMADAPYGKCLLVRDPDGHVVMLVQQ
jgi:hypothetical protein